MPPVLAERLIMFQLMTMNAQRGVDQRVDGVTARHAKQGDRQLHLALGLRTDAVLACSRLET